MHDKVRTKSPADFGNPDEWRQYVERTVPPEEVAYTLAFRRTILFARFYEARNRALPRRFCADLAELVSLPEPERTCALEALNGQIFADMTQFLCSTAQIKHQSHAGCGDMDSRRLIDELITVVLSNSQRWEEFAATSAGATEEQDIEFATLMVQLGRLLLHFREQNLALPAHTFSRSWFLHCLRGTERNAHARAVVQDLTEALHSCAFA
jgi:hypothetical protein